LKREGFSRKKGTSFTLRINPLPGRNLPIMAGNPLQKALPNKGEENLPTPTEVTSNPP